MSRCSRCGRPLSTAGQCYFCWPDEPFVAPAIQTVPGWLCPRCGTIHSPFVLKCECLPSHVIKIDINTGGEP